MRGRAKKMTTNMKNAWRSKNLIAFVFLMPWILGFLIFQAVYNITILFFYKSFHAERTGMDGAGKLF